MKLLSETLILAMVITILAYGLYAAPNIMDVEEAKGAGKYKKRRSRHSTAGK